MILTMSAPGGQGQEVSRVRYVVIAAARAVGSDFVRAHVIEVG
jgi:hypothetical protein